MTKLKVVKDTNIYLSGIIFGGNSRHILDILIEKKIIGIASPAILLEISQKLEKKFKWGKEQILITIKTIGKTATIIRPKKRLNIVTTDKNDNKIIEAGVEGRADYIITGDRHLLRIKKYGNIKIVSPAEFLSLYLKQ
ncbi:putative toxin-antitoxin system toxin component, PIN family [Candidatus Gottesmanbacteria bacterium]|nr:putative toxin-antitoxin system toxin component, PIN family [Candidatus Gottesmanbacteria bacterium]